MEENGVRAVTEFIVARETAHVTQTWCVVHPVSYKATISSATRSELASHGQPIGCFPAYNTRSEKCECTVRVDRMGMYLNDCTPSVPLWMVVWHVQLLYRLFGSAVEVSVVDLDTTTLDTLLRRWEGTEVKVTSITSRRRLTACVSRYQRATGRVFSALSNVESLDLLPSPFEDAALAVAEHLPTVRRIVASGCRVEYVTPLRQLYQLRELHLAETGIRDRELTTLAGLPLLESLDLSACPQLTTLDPLASSPALRELRAAGCERLVRVAEVSAIASLRLVDLSENLFLPSEFAAFLTRHPLRLHTGLFMHVRWPREPPPAAAAHAILSTVTHLHLSYSTLPNVQWLCGANNLEQLFLNHTNVTAADLARLVSYVPFLRVLSVSYCERLVMDVGVVRSLPHLSILMVSRSSLLAVPAPDLAALQRSITVTLS